MLTEHKTEHTFIDLVGFTEKLQRLCPPEILTTSQGHEYLFNPKSGETKLLPTWPEKRPVESRSVSSVESLAKVALEELTRSNNETGSGMTVSFDNKGATLYVNDLVEEAKHIQWRYNRCFSQQWMWLVKYADQVFEHREFVRVIQGLKPSIADYKEFFRSIRRANITDKTDVVSNPIIEDGQLGSSVSFNLKVENGETKATIPTELHLIMPYTRCSEEQYALTVDIDVERIKKDTHHTAGFRLKFVEQSIIEDQAVTDEIRKFEELTQDKPGILKVLNFS
jgi:hypothetical protein